MKGFLDYLPGNSILHRLHPLTKMLGALLICAAAFCSSNFIFLCSIILFNLLLGVTGNGKNSSGLLKRTLGIFKGLMKMSVLLFILQLFAIRSGNIVIHLWKNFGFTDTAIKNGLLLVLRLTGATLPLSILISVTNLTDLSNTLVRELHIPYKYAFTLTSAISFIPVFSNEMNAIIDCQKARGIDFEIKNPFKKISMILPLCFPLLLSSVRKIEDTATAAELRGFYLRTKQSCSKEYRHHFRDFLFLLLCTAVLTGGIIF